MNRARDNPDRDFSAEYMDAEEAQALRDLLKSTDIASSCDAVARERIGVVIGRSVFNPRKQLW
jgi:hypothetical protein